MFLVVFLSKNFRKKSVGHKLRFFSQYDTVVNEIYKLYNSLLTSSDSISYTMNDCNWARRPCCLSPCKCHILPLSPHQLQRASPCPYHLSFCTWQHKFLSVSSLPHRLFLFEVATKREISPLSMVGQTSENGQLKS